MCCVPKTYNFTSNFIHVHLSLAKLQPLCFNISGCFVFMYCIYSRGEKEVDIRREEPDKPFSFSCSKDWKATNKKRHTVLAKEEPSTCIATLVESKTPSLGTGTDWIKKEQKSHDGCENVEVLKYAYPLPRNKVMGGWGHTGIRLSVCLSVDTNYCGLLLLH